MPDAPVTWLPAHPHRDRREVTCTGRCRGLAAPCCGASPMSSLGRPVDDVVLGNCMGPGGDVARVAALAAGLPVEVPAMTVDRQRGSGGCDRDGCRTGAGVTGARPRGRHRVGFHGDPWRFWPPEGDEAPRRFERAPFAPEDVGDPDMGLAADLLSQERGVSPDRQDAYAAQSHARANATQQGGFEAELVPSAGSSATSARALV